MKTTARKNWCGVSSPTSTRRYLLRGAHSRGAAGAQVRNRSVATRSARGAARESGHATDLQVAAAAAYALGDVLDLYWANDSGIGVGLREEHGVPIGTNPATLDGHPASSPVDQRRGCERPVHLELLQTRRSERQLSVTGPSGENGKVTVTFNSREPDAQATITGRLAEGPSWRPCMRRKRVIHGGVARFGSKFGSTSSTSMISEAPVFYLRAFRSSSTVLLLLFLSFIAAPRSSASPRRTRSPRSSRVAMPCSSEPTGTPSSGPRHAGKQTSR